MCLDADERKAIGNLEYDSYPILLYLVAYRTVAFIYIETRVFPVTTSSI